MVREKQISIVIVIVIAVLLVLLGLYSFSAGYRTGSDMAYRDHRN